MVPNTVALRLVITPSAWDFLQTEGLAGADFVDIRTGRRTCVFRGSRTGGYDVPGFTVQGREIEGMRAGGAHDPVDVYFGLDVLLVRFASVTLQDARFAGHATQKIVASGRGEVTPRGRRLPLPVVHSIGAGKPSPVHGRPRPFRAIRSPRALPSPRSPRRRGPSTPPPSGRTDRGHRLAATPASGRVGRWRFAPRRSRSTRRPPRRRPRGPRRPDAASDRPKDR